jgi:hypothetical protein
MYFHKLLGGIITVILIISVYEIFVSVYVSVSEIFELFYIESNKSLAYVSVYVSVYEIFELFYIESNENLADVFTKALPVPAHRGLHSPPTWWPCNPLVIGQGCVRIRVQ